jgi:hypothetical protein
MAKIRFGYSDDFTAKNSAVGINTTEPQEKLDVVGVVKGQDFKVTGISSFTAYEGFLRADHQIAENTTLSFDQGPSASLSGEIIVGTGVTVTIASVGLGTTTVGNGSGTIENTIDTTDATRAGGSEIECLKVFNTFTPPNGGTNERPYAPKPGELYYNYDFKTIEFFDGYGWRQVDNTTRAGRAVSFGGLVSPSVTVVKTIGYWNIHTLGNAQNFGEATLNTRMNAACSNGSRGLFAGAFPANQETIEYVTIPSEGNSIDFGDLSGDRSDVQMGSASSSTRGIWAGGSQEENIIDYVEMATLGDALDFGDLTQGRRNLGGFSSPTRGVFSSGGETPSFKNNNDYITIASKGNAILWNEIVRSGLSGNCASNQTRGVFAGGYNTVDNIKSIDYVTIASLGNTIEFGDLSIGRNGASAASTQTRVVFAGGFTTFPSATDSVANSMEYIEIASAGNAIDFGDYLTTIAQAGATSDSHGGLGGF